MLLSVDQWIAVTGLSKRTIQTYKTILTDLLTWCDRTQIGLEHLTPADLLTWLDDHPRWRDNMRHLAQSAVRSYVRWRFGYSHPVLAMRLKPRTTAPQRSLTVEQVQELLASFDPYTPIGIRDLAIVTLMLDTGLREAELCRLDMQYLNQSERMLSVIIKGGRWGTAVYSDYTASCLYGWLALRTRIARPGVTTVFVGVLGSQPGTPITPSGLRCIFRSWGRRINLKLSPHDLRRTFAMLATRSGAPARVLQVAGRWSNISMVELYTRSIIQEDFRPYLPINTIMNLKE